VHKTCHGGEARKHELDVHLYREDSQDMACEGKLWRKEAGGRSRSLSKRNVVEVHLTKRVSVRKGKEVGGEPK
jgi:hypothetical protein